MLEQTTPRLTQLDRDAVRTALEAAVGDEVVGALVRVDGEEGPWVATAGSAVRGEARPPDPDGFFRIGSITKAFVATVVLHPVAEGDPGSGGSLYGYSAVAFGDRGGRRRCVLGLNVATDDALATGDTLLELTRVVFCGP
jgi:hypothetical protein